MAVGPDPPQRVPVVVVVVDEHATAGLARDVGQPPQRVRALGLGVDGAVDVVAVDREHDRHQVGTARRRRRWPAARPAAAANRSPSLARRSRLAGELGDRRLPALERRLDHGPAGRTGSSARRAGSRRRAARSERRRVGGHAHHHHVDRALGPGAQLLGAVEDALAARSWETRRRRRRARGRARSVRCRRRGPAGGAAAPAWARTRSARSRRTRRGSWPRPGSRSPSWPRRARASARMRVRGSVPWLRISSRFQPAPTPNSNRPPERWSSEATSLAVMIGSRSMTRQIPLPTRSARGRLGGRGQGDEQVVACGCTCAAARRRRDTGSRGWPGCGCARRRTATRGRAPRPAARARPGPSRRGWGSSRFRSPCPESIWAVAGHWRSHRRLHRCHRAPAARSSRQRFIRPETARRKEPDVYLSSNHSAARAGLRPPWPARSSSPSTCA